MSPFFTSLPVVTRPQVLSVKGLSERMGLRPGDRLGLSQLFVLYDEGDYPHPGELRALLHGGVRVPRGYHQARLAH